MINLPYCVVSKVSRKFLKKLCYHLGQGSHRKITLEYRGRERSRQGSTFYKLMVIFSPNLCVNRDKLMVIFFLNLCVNNIFGQFAFNSPSL